MQGWRAMTTCPLCGDTHGVDRETAFVLARRYPLTICFVARVIDQLDGDLDRAEEWLDAWASFGIYPTPDYYKSKVMHV